MLGLFHALLVSLLVLLPADIRPVSAADPLYVLNLFLWKSPNNFPTQQILEGFKAALFNTGTGADGRTIELIEPDLSSGSIAEAIEKAMTAHPSIMAIAGPVSDELLAETLAYTKEHYPTLTAVGPFTNYLESRVWSPQAYFLRADPTAEFLAVATDIIHRLRVKRVGLFRLTGTKFSQKGYDVIRSALIVMHRITLVEYVEPEESPFNQSAFDKFASDDPQAILMYSSVVQHTYEFVSACRHSVALMLTPIFFTSGGYIALYDSIIAPDVPLNFFFSSTNLLPVDTMYEVIRVFNSQMSDYIASGKSSFTSMDQVKMPITGSLTVAGWITGKVLRSGMLVAEAVVDRKAYQVSLFDQRQYAVEHSDILGVFGGVCGAYEIMQQAICKCNQGGHTVNIYKIFIPSTNTAPIDPATTPAALPLGNDPLYAAARQSSFTFPRRICYAADYAVPVYVQAVILSVSNDAPLADAVLSVQASLSGAIEAYSSEPGADIGATVAPCTSQASLLSYAKNYLVDVVIGPLIDPRDTAALLPSTLIVNPLALYPTPRIALRNTLYLMPTVDQQVYLVARVAKHQRADLVILRRLQPPRPAITAVLHNAEQIYGIAITSLDAASVTRISSSAEKLIVLAIGIDSAFVASLPRWMEQHPHAYFSVLLEEFSLYYSAFTQVFASEPIEVQRRILTFTNLPMWNDYSEETAASFPDLAKYHETVDKEFVNPLSLEAWYSAGILRKVLSCQSGNTTSTLLECTYHLSTYSFGGLAFGNLAWDSSCPSAFSPLCRNFGAKNMNIISMAKALNNSAEVAAGPFTVDVVPPTPVSFNVTEFAAITAPLFAVVAICLSLVLYFCCWKSARDNHFAPKNAAQPVTIMFTDIQSSTALWAEFPEEMVEAMESHHEIIRNEIRKFECYEVKTIGDSFMIACTDALKAVQLSVSIQKALFQYDWGTSAFDAFYSSGDHPGDPIVGAQNTGPHGDAEMGNDTSFNAGLQGDPEEGEIQNSFISGLPANYKEKWHGLRVRIGIHTGMCDIRFDEVTKGFDYYGDTVNIAARTEATAMGGQILITKNTWDDACKSSDSRCVARLTVTDYGAHTLRGVSHAVDMYEVEGVPNRVFSVAVKGKEDEASSDDDGDPETRSLDSFTEMVGPNVKNTFAETTFKIVSGVLSTFHHKRKVELLKEIMRQWRVPTEVRKSDPNDEKAFTVLLSRFVNSRAKVMARREYLRETPMQGSLTAHSSTTSPTAVAPAQRRCSITFSGMGVGVGSPSPHCSAQRSRDASCCRLPRGEVPPWSAAAQRRESGRWRVGSSGPQRRIPSASPSRQRLGALATEIAVPPIQSISERPHTSSDALCVSPQTLLEALPVPMPPKWCDARLSSGSDTRNPLIQHSTAAIMASDTERTQAGSTDKPGTASPEAATGSQPVSEGVGAGQPGRLPKQLEEEETKITTTKK